MTVAKRTRVAKPRPLRVTLPDGSEFLVTRLLGKGDNNPKLLKNGKSGDFQTFGLSLSPARTSGYQLCASSTEGCRKVCLHYQGRGGVFPEIHRARLAKSVAFMEHRKWFERELRWEFDRLRAKRDMVGRTQIVRLNVMSDVMWENVFPWVFETNPEVQFYDYTKHQARMVRWLRGELPGNYHLTFSRSETNHDECLAILREGGTVTVVFRSTLPRKWCGFPVVDGDLTDLRFLDPPGSWVGLKAKGTARNDTSGFVVPTRVPLM